MNATVSNRMIRSVHLSGLPMCALGLIMLLSGCVSTAKYTPAVKDKIPVPSDQVASVTIPVAVQMVKLVDISPAEDKEDGWLYGSGWSVTSPERLKGPLDVVLKDAIMNDFKEHGLFKDLDQQDLEDQLKLEGKVHRFYQRREHYLWSLCCGLLGILIPFPLMKEEGEVNIELSLTRPDGTTLRSYRGQSSFLKRCNFYESRCNESYNSSPAKYLDEAFGDTMSQIRTQIIKDRDVIVQRISHQTR